MKRLEAWGLMALLATCIVGGAWAQSVVIDQQPAQGPAELAKLPGVAGILLGCVLLVLVAAVLFFCIAMRKMSTRDALKKTGECMRGDN